MPSLDSGEEVGRPNTQADHRAHSLFAAHIHEEKIFRLDVKDEAVGGVGSGGYEYGIVTVGLLIGDEAGHECAGAESINQDHLGERHLVLAEQALHGFPDDAVERQGREPLLLQSQKETLPHLGAYQQADQEKEGHDNGQHEEVDEPAVDIVGKTKQVAQGADKPDNQVEQQPDDEYEKRDGKHYYEAPDDGSNHETPHLAYQRPFALNKSHVQVELLHSPNAFSACRVVYRVICPVWQKPCGADRSCGPPDWRECRLPSSPPRRTCRLRPRG